MQTDEIVGILIDIIFNILSHEIPHRTVKCDDRDPPWIAKELKTAIMRKHRVYRRYIRYIERGKNSCDWCKVKTIRNEASRMMANAKNKYYDKLGRMLSDPNIGKYWPTLARLINNKKTCNIPPLVENGLFITDPTNIARIVNEHFFQKCSVLQNTSSLPTFLPRIGNRIEHISIQKDKVLKWIRVLDTKKSHGCDQISVAMIRICGTSTVDPLCMIFEKSLRAGNYPSTWKKAYIIPVHKKESRQSKRNYRPVSLFSEEKTVYF